MDHTFLEHWNTFGIGNISYLSRNPEWCRANKHLAMKIDFQRPEQDAPALLFSFLTPNDILPMDILEAAMNATKYPGFRTKMKEMCRKLPQSAGKVRYTTK